MTNLTRSGAAALVVVLVSAGPVAAQYEPSTTTAPPTTTTTRPPTATTSRPPTTAAPTTTPTTVRTTTSTTPEQQANTTTTTAPPAAVLVVPQVSAPVVPGEPVTITAPSSVEFAADAADDADVQLSGTGANGTTVQPEVQVTVVNGRLSVEVTVPPGTPEQILILTIVVPDARGVLRTIVTLLPVSGGPRAAAFTGGGRAAVLAGPAGGAAAPLAFEELPIVPTSLVPEVVRQLQASIPDDDTERQLLEQLTTNPQASLVIHGAKVLVSTDIPLPDGEEGRSPAVALVAAALAAAGLVVFRRRRVPSHARNL